MYLPNDVEMSLWCEGYLSSAIIKGDINNIKGLLDLKDGRIDTERMFSTYLLIALDDEKITEVLINDTKNRFPTNKFLNASCSTSDINRVRKLLSKYTFSATDLSHALSLASSGRGFRVNEDAQKVETDFQEVNEICTLLLSNPETDPTYNHNEAIIHACSMENIELVNMLLKYPNINPVDQNGIALLRSIEKGRLDILELLINNDHLKVLIKDNNATLSIVALVIEQGYANLVKIIKFLLNNVHIDASVLNNKALIVAVKQLNDMKIEYDEACIYYNENPSDKDQLEWYEIAFNNCISVVALLLNEEKVWNKLTNAQKVSYSSLIGG